MAKRDEIKNLRGQIRRDMQKYWEIQGRIKELEEREEELKDELEIIREHLSYYESLVSDMKKDMKAKRSTDVFEEL
ncbi:MAG: hypothetical protein ACOCSJ_00025 [Candidatus Natronoplasma sp.]